MVPPKLIAEQNDALAAGTRFLGREGATEKGTNAKHGEELGRHGYGENCLGLLFVAERQATAAVNGHGLE